MKLNPYLSFDGRCETAFKHYEQCLGGKIEMMLTYGDSPAESQTPENWRKKIMHARLIFGDNVLMGSDAPPDRFQGVKGIYVALNVDTAADAERIFKALAENGAVQMPLEKTFFAIRFGMLIDQFGIPWMINCEQGA